MIAIDENFRISETGGTGNATIFVNATTENPFSTASTQIEVSSSVGNIKRYVTLNKKAAHGYMYTPVEWISNEDINSQIWIDLGYTWTNTSKAEIGMIIPTGNTANGTEIFGEWFDWQYRNGQYEPVNDATDDLRLFFDGNKCYWDTPNNNRTQLAYERGKAIIWQFGNQYLNNVNKKTTNTGTTTDFGTRTSTVGLFGAPASGGYTHKARFYYVKIWEGDTLVRDIIPVLDKDNIPCFLDKANATFYYYKVNGVPSTGLTAGGAIAEYSYIDNGGVTSSYNCYIPINYVWKTNSRAVMSLKVQSAQSGHIFSDEDGSNRLRLYPNSYGQFQMEYRGTTISSSSRGWSNVQNIEMGNYYIKDTDTGTDIATGTTKTANQTTYCFLFGYSDKIQFYSVKIYEGDTLVCDLVPAMANNGYKGFWDKKREQFFFDRSNQNGRLYVGTKVQDIVVTQIYSESDITINNETPSTAISAGNTFNLNASTTPTGVTLSYSSSDTSVATVDSNGVVTAVGKGTATITITAQGFQDNVNKVYYNTTSKAVSIECEERNGYSYTPVEYVSNEGLLDKHWVDLDYIWKDNSKVQLGFYSVYTNTKESWQVFGEDNQFDANGNVINDNDDVRLFLYNDSAYWDVTNRRVQRSSWSTSLYNNWHNVELGNNYVKDIDTGNQTTGSTYSISRANTVGLFGSPKYALSNTDRIRYKYIKIYEGDTLVKDIIPVLDSNNIPCFYDKVNGTFHYYKVDGQPSTGLTAGNVYEELDYLQGDGSDYVVLDYIPNTTSIAEIDCDGRSNSEAFLFGIQHVSNNNACFRIAYPSSNTGAIRFDWGNFRQNYSSSPKITSRAVLKLTPTAGYIDDEKAYDISGTWSNISGPIGLFQFLRYTESTGAIAPYSSNYYTGKIYGFKVYEGETLVREYVPAKVGSTRGFYDKVLGNFYPSNSNTLVTGTVVGNLTINVTYSEDDVTISNNTPSGALTVGDLFSLGASTTPTGATLSYSSSDTSIATVGISGIITAVATGTTTITITASDVFDNVNKVYYKGTSKTVSVEVQGTTPTSPIYFDASNPGNANINKIASDGLSGVTKNTTAAKTVYFNVDSSATSSQSPYFIHTSDTLAQFYDPDGSLITGRSVSGYEIWIPMDCNKTGTYKLLMPSSFIMSSATFEIIPPSS